MQKSRFKFLILVISIVLLFAAGIFFRVDPQALGDYLKNLPFQLGGVIYTALYVVVTFFFWFSKDIFRFLGAVIFGAYYSSLLVFIAESINAVILFFLARYFGREFTKGMLKDSGRGLDRKLEDSNLFWLILFRAAPLIPFRLMDLAAGLTGITFRRYMLAVILGSPVRIFWLQYIMAGVGLSIFKKPDMLTAYLISHKTVFVLSLAYLFVVATVGLKLRRKG
jgi:uncharacterized membrane protein YdjX (TVP38/TMEM64 family)